MTIIYEDDIYPEDLIAYDKKREKYRGKTIKQILNEHSDPQKFISVFNRSNKYCLSDEIGIYRRYYGGFTRNWQRN